MSSEDIDKGSRWSTTISAELEKTNFGILCLTPENVNAPWISFEAGALAKVIDQSNVAPLLFGLQPSDVQGPLAQFQVTKFEPVDFKRLMRTLNACAQEEARAEARLDKVLETFWPQLHDEIAKILAKNSGSPKREAVLNADKTRPILEEILVLARQQSTIISDPTNILPISYLRDLLRRTLDSDVPRYAHPAWRDLERGWTGLQKGMLELDEASAEKLRPSVRSLERSISYLLDEVRRPMRIRRSFAEAREEPNLVLPTASIADPADPTAA